MDDTPTVRSSYPPIWGVVVVKTKRQREYHPRRPDTEKNRSGRERRQRSRGTGESEAERGGRDRRLQGLNRTRRDPLRSVSQYVLYDDVNGTTVTTTDSAFSTTPSSQERIPEVMRGQFSVFQKVRRVP